MTYTWVDVIEGQVADDVAINGLGNAVEGHDTELTNRPRGIIASGIRATASSSTTSEIGVLRLDGIVVLANRKLAIVTTPLGLYSNVASDVVAAKVRVNFIAAPAAGAAATTASPQVGQPMQQVSNATSTSFPEGRSMIQYYTPPSDGTLSVLITVGRIAGTGNAAIQQPFELTVDDRGIAPSNTGVSL